MSWTRPPFTQCVDWLRPRREIPAMGGLLVEKSNDYMTCLV